MNAPNTDPTALTAMAEHSPVAMDTSTSALMFIPERLNAMLAMAEIMAAGMATVPQHLRKNKGDCLAVCMQAAQWRLNPFAVAQKTHLVNGTLGYEAQLVNAVVNTMAPTKDRINYEWFGDWSKVMGKFEERESKKKVDEDTGKPLKYRVPAWGIKDEEGLGVKVWATMKGESEPRVLVLMLVQSRTRNSPLWADDPRQQLAYLAVKRWTRLHCPDVLLGVYTPDELMEPRAAKDMGAAVVVETDDAPDELLIGARQAADKGRDSFGAWWKAAKPDQRRQLRDHMGDLETRVSEADKKRTVDAATSQPAANASGEAPATGSAPEGAAGDDPWLADLKRGETEGATA